MQIQVETAYGVGDNVHVLGYGDVQITDVFVQVNQSGNTITYGIDSVDAEIVHAGDIVTRQATPTFAMGQTVLFEHHGQQQKAVVKAVHHVEPTLIGYTLELDDYQIDVMQEEIIGLSQENPNANLFDSLKAIEFESQIGDDFTHIGNIEKVYPDYETKAYRTDIWENKDGIRIATWDLGNSHLRFMGDGSLEGFIAYEKALDEAQSGIIATPCSSVHFPKNEAFDHLPEIYDWTFNVATSTDEGITINYFFDFVFPHGSYRVSYTPELGEITA